MESANFRRLQQQDQLLVDTSCFGVSCYQYPILNSTRNNACLRDVKHHMNHQINPVPMEQDVESPWSTTSTGISMESFMSFEQQLLARIKHELSYSGFSPGLSEITSSSPTSSVEDFMLKNNPQRLRHNIDANQDMLLKTFSNRCQIKGDHLNNQIPSMEESVICYSNDTNRCYTGTFSQILPTINISNLNQSSASPLAISTNVFDINLPALDPLGSPPFDGRLCNQPSSINVHDYGGFFKDNYLAYGLDQLNNKISPAFVIQNTEPKRPASKYMDTNASKGTPSKKSKMELRSSCTPLKVRKEKLGDRISALQQMVAPFGKTDTASVLMEAIGYIKFLQNQVETLSVPYMNSADTDGRTSTQECSIKDDGNEEITRGLRSRGLCLVPLSCLSYVSYGGGSVWTTP